MTSDASFWIKFLHESDLPVNNNTLLQYATALTSRFTTIEDLVIVDENELIRLGITNQSDRACIIKQAHLFDERENLPLTRQSSASDGSIEHWLGGNQSTPLNPQSKCNLSPALLSRISFNDRPSYDESTINNKDCHFEYPLETPKRLAMVDNNEKIKTLLDSCKKITSPSSTHGMRPVKSLSDTISLQKKVSAGTDRLKRLTLPRSLFKRQTALLTKKVSNITNKLLNPFAKMTNKNDPKAIDNGKLQPSQTVIDNSIKRIQMLSLNNDIQRSTHIPSRDDEVASKYIAQPSQTLPTKRFKLGAPTTFLTRSLANHGHTE